MDFKQGKGHISIIVSCIIFATNIILTNALVGTWMTPMGYTLTRLVYGVAVLWIMSLFFKREKVSGKDLFVLAIGGVLGFIVSQFAFALSLRYTTPVNYSLIMAMVPVVVLVLSFFFLKEKITSNKSIGILLSVIGATVIILQRKTGSEVGTNNILGVLIAFLSMSSYGIYLMITREVSQKYSSITILKWMFLITAILLLPFGYKELMEQKIYSSSVTMVPIVQLLTILIFDATLVYFLLLIALRNLKATTVSTYMNFLPVFTSVLAVIGGQELFTLNKMLAIVLVIGGVTLVTRSNGKAK
nr:DMT family transporter [uncultured Carboxylicivirga sp.]